jgi:2-oxoglutarate dehydrogenase E2 component (dihydrolipoamide succinyltransferase)
VVADIAVPKLNNNDETYVLVEWLYADGQQVPAGEAAVVVETSKATEEVPCEDGGVLHRLAAVGDECRPGEVIGLLFGTERDREAYLAARASAEHTDDGPTALVVTDAAKELARQHGIGEEELRRLGRSVIRYIDVERLVQAPLPAPVRPANRAQQAIAEVVTEAHRTIPAAFTVSKVDVSTALAAAREVAARTERLIGLPDLLVLAAARLRDDFPAFFVGAPAGPVDIAVTVDVGRGLHLPVLRDVANRDVGEVADALMELRIRAMRGEFRESDFAGAALTVSLNNEDGVLFAAPIIFPGQVCMVSLGATMPELMLGEDGTIGTRQVAHIGIAYDHRVVNGRDAAAFLRGLGRYLNTVEVGR